MSRVSRKKKKDSPQESSEEIVTTAELQAVVEADHVDDASDDAADLDLSACANVLKGSCANCLFGSSGTTEDPSSHVCGQGTCLACLFADEQADKQDVDDALLSANDGAEASCLDSCVACLFGACDTAFCAEGEADEAGAACGEGSCPESCLTCLFCGDASSSSDASEEDGLPLEGIVEAILIAATGPLTAKTIQKMTQRKIKPEAVDDVICSLNTFYEQQGRAFEVLKVNGAYQIMTLPAYAAILNPNSQTEPEAKRLSPAMLDTLAIIAYKQPLMRVDVEEIRGVGCGTALRSLIEHGLVKVAGRRSDIPGQPMLYGTTERFLEVFGLGDIADLPSIDALRLG